MHPGLPGKILFPKFWGEERIMHHVSDVATDSKIPWNFNKKVNGLDRFIAEGVRTDLGETVRIRVVVEPAGKGIITAFPIE